MSRGHRPTQRSSLAPVKDRESLARSRRQPHKRPRDQSHTMRRPAARWTSSTRAPYRARTAASSPTSRRQWRGRDRASGGSWFRVLCARSSLEVHVSRCDVELNFDIRHVLLPCSGRAGSEKEHTGGGSPRCKRRLHAHGHTNSPDPQHVGIEPVWRQSIRAPRTIGKLRWRQFDQRRTAPRKAVGARNVLSVDDKKRAAFSLRPTARCFLEPWWCRPVGCPRTGWLTKWCTRQTRWLRIGEVLELQFDHVIDDR